MFLELKKLIKTHLQTTFFFYPKTASSLNSLVLNWNYIFWDCIIDISHLCLKLSVKCCQELSNCLARLKPLQPQPGPVERQPNVRPSPKKIPSSPASIRHGGCLFFFLAVFLVSRLEDGIPVLCTYAIFYIIRIWKSTIRLKRATFLFLTMLMECWWIWCESCLHIFSSEMYHTSWPNELFG